jgi:hypothetical protein
VHILKIRDKDLKVVSGGNPEGKNFEGHMETFMESASQIASFIYLDTFVKPTEVQDTPEEELAKEDEEENE